MKASDVVHKQADDFFSEIADLLQSDRINPGEYMGLGFYVVRMHEVADLLAKYEIKAKWEKRALLCRTKAE